MGLQVLLGAGCVLRCAGAELAFRSGDAGTLFPLAHEYRGRQRVRSHSTGVRNRARDRADRAHRRRAFRLQRHGAGCSGNQAYEQHQHDTYGNIILGATQPFFDRRLYMAAGLEEFRRLESLGERAFVLHDQPDAGMWELRTRMRPHTSSAIMSWAGCDRLAKIAAHIGLRDRAQFWRERADKIKGAVLERSWSEKRQAFVESFGGTYLDASVLLMSEVGMLAPTDPRFIATVDAMERTLARGPFMMRYEEADDFGAPETAFNVCAFWRVDALARIGRRDEAREIFEALLAARAPSGLMSEDTDFATGEAWGNFPQTYSMVGIINGAVRLSKSWESMV
ncbi:MAG: glycoside hydrolase family 15 protein [Hyphomicrobiaceae bacterium]